MKKINTKDSELLIIKVAIKYGIAEKDKLISVLPDYKKQKKEDPDLNIGSYLVKLKMITEKQLQFLHSVLKMAEVNEQDRNFGIIAIKNNFTSQFHIKKALQYQARLFKKSYSIQLIGDILVEWDKILPEQRDAIMSRQNRLEDDREKMHFGKIGVEKKFFTENDLEDALKEQWRFFKREKKIKLLGEVLVDKEKLSLSQRDSILSSQRDLLIKLTKDQKNKKTKTSEIETDDDTSSPLDSLTDISNQEKYFAAIAIKNNLISLDQVKQAFKKQSKIFKESSSVKLIGDILIDAEIMDETYRDAILSRQKRLEIKDEDVQFGTIAVREGYVSQESVDQALEIQLKEFEQKKQITLLGDILVAAGDLTNEQLQEILGRQRELKALLVGNNGRSSLPEPSSEELKTEDETPEQADADIEKSDETQSQEPSEPDADEPDISDSHDKEDITDETDDTEDEDISKEDQPEKEDNIEDSEITKDDIDESSESSGIEKEDNIESSSPEEEEEPVLPPPPPKPKRFSFPLIRVAQDKMEAFIFVKHHLRPSTTVDDIKSLLAQRDIKYGIIPDEEIQSYIDTPELHNKPFLVAKGDVVEQPKDDEIVYHFALERKPGTEKEDGAMDFKDRGEHPHVLAGQLVAERIPGTPGQEGKNIFGDIDRLEKYERKMLLCGKGVQISSDRNKAYAKLSGLPQLSSRGQLSIENELFIHGDVDMKTGHIKYEGLVSVRGVVESNFLVRAQRLTAQAIMAADIETSGDITVKGGIIGAKIRTNGQVHAKFIKSSNITVGGNIYVEKEILDSHITTRGECVIDRGRVMASDISAAKGIVAKSVGSDTSPECQLTIGTDSTTLITLLEYQRELSLHNKELNNLEEPIINLKKHLQDIDEQIQDLNVLIDRIEDAKPGAEKRLSLLRQTNKKRDIRMFEDKLLNMDSKINSANESKKLFQEEWDKLQKEINDYDPKKLARIDTIKEEIIELEDKIKKLRSEIRRNKGKFSVTIHGSISKGTTINGPESTLILEEDMNNVIIQEFSKIVKGQEEKNMVAQKNEDKNSRRRRRF